MKSQKQIRREKSKKIVDVLLIFICFLDLVIFLVLLYYGYHMPLILYEVGLGALLGLVLGDGAARLEKNG